MKFYTTPGLTNFADTYGSGVYGNSTYSCNSATSTCGATTTNNSGSGGASLVNTGVAIGLVVGLACAIALVAVLVRFWRRPAKKSGELDPKA